MINGTAGHALDYDDVALAGHPSTVLVPALLAEGEAIGASGADLLRAYLVGYEVWAELIGRDADSHHIKGWHPTAVFGTVGAAAAIAALRRLSIEVCRNAISLSASMAGGLVANFGTMTKPLHAGRAASSAIEAVRLAMGGMTAAPDAIEHDAGFLKAISPKGQVDLERPSDGLGRSLRILESGLSVKKYPICYATHRVIDAVIDLARKHDLRPDNVESVEASIGVAQASMLRNHTPVTGLEAKFSLEFAVASALVARAVGLGAIERRLRQSPRGTRGDEEGRDRHRSDHVPHRAGVRLQRPRADPAAGRPMARQRGDPLRPGQCQTSAARGGTEGEVLRLRRGRRVTSMRTLCTRNSPGSTAVQDVRSLAGETMSV